MNDSMRIVRAALREAIREARQHRRATRGCFSMPYDYDVNARYNVCRRCGFVRRNWWAMPLLHKGRKP